MNVRLITPDTELDRTHIDDRYVFLAGPIQGAPLWQPESAETMAEVAQKHPSKGTLIIVSPRRNGLSSDFNYDNQVAYEKRYLRRASQYGANMFWFANQDPNVPYEDGRPYGKTTFGEFNRVFGWRDYNPNVNICTGMEPGYDGLSSRYIKTMLKEHKELVYRDLSSLSHATVNLVLSQLES